jgi:hypothetical protein
MTAGTVELARRYGRFGHRKVTGLLNRMGWQVNQRPAGVFREA